MIIDMKSARDGNTVNQWTETIWRVFLNEKLFKSDSGQTCFNTKEEAEQAVNDSKWMKFIKDYVRYSQEFFGKIDDEEWATDFESRVIEHVNLEYKEYKCTE